MSTDQKALNPEAACRPPSRLLYAVKVIGSLACGLAAEIATHRGMEDASYRQLRAWAQKKQLLVPMPTYATWVRAPALNTSVEDLCV